MKGVYRLTNTVTGDFYIGQSCDLERRRIEHFSRIGGTYAEHPLYSDMIRYGKDVFVFEIIAQVDDEIERSTMERNLIKSLQPKYNTKHTDKAHLTENAKKHLSECGKRQWEMMSDEQKAKVISKQLVGPRIGHNVSAETRLKLRNAKIGKKMSDETKRKISEANKGKNNNKGHYKAVVALLDGNIQYLFGSINAAAKFLGVDPSCITGVLKGRRKHCRGYEWKYYKDWSVETNCDECSSVGVDLSHVEVRGSLRGEEIVRAAEMANLRVIR